MQDENENEIWWVVHQSSRETLTAWYLDHSQGDHEFAGVKSGWVG